MIEVDVLTNNDYFSVNSEGELTFTEQGIAEYRSYFGKAGVDIRNIKSLEDFRRARRAASPFFEDHLAAKVKKGEKTLERRLSAAGVHTFRYRQPETGGSLQNTAPDC